MIISEQKPFEDILQKIHGKSVFIIGCNECATLCHVGGEPEVIEMEKKLKQRKINVTGWIILDPACHVLNSKRLFKSKKEEIERAQCLLTLSCGNGVQVIHELYPTKQIISGTNTLFLGAEIKRGVFEQECKLCGTCIIDTFEGFCPISHCPKQMLNGPCGGSINGKCELGNDLDCIWDKIIQRKQELHIEKTLLYIEPPKDWTSYKRYQWRDNYKL